MGGSGSGRWGGSKPLAEALSRLDLTNRKFDSFIQRRREVALRPKIFALNQWVQYDMAGGPNACEGLRWRVAVRIHLSDVFWTHTQPACQAVINGAARIIEWMIVVGARYVRPLLTIEFAAFHAAIVAAPLHDALAAPVVGNEHSPRCRVTLARLRLSARRLSQ
jgi:hypothetical protein